MLAADVASGQEVSFALGGGGGAAGPRLYDYRPLYRAYIEERADRLLDLADGRAALAALERDPGVLAYAETHAPGSTRPAEALRRSVLVPLLVGVAERCDGFDFDVEAFDAVYGAVERGVTAKETRISAFTPLSGLLLSNPPADLGAGVTIRRVARRDRRALARVVRSRARRLRPRAGRAALPRARRPCRRASGSTTPPPLPGMP